VQCSSVGCSLAQWKNIRPWSSEFWSVGKHFVSGNSLFFILGAKLGGGGAQRSVWRVNVPEKTGARSARAHTSGQKTGNPKKSFQTLYIKMKLYIAFI
jgi:hypothetical protein